MLICEQSIFSVIILDKGVRSNISVLIFTITELYRRMPNGSVELND